MSKMRSVLGLGVATAMLASPVTPAFAGSYGGISIGGGSGGLGYGLGYGRSWGGDRYRRHRGRHHDRVDAGDVIGAIAVIGVIAAVASAASKAKGTSRRDRDEDRYPDRRDDDRRSGRISSEDQAVNACAVAAEQRAGETASVRDISDVRRASDGWDVEGVVEQRDGWRDRDADRRKFTCSVRYGQVEDVYIEGSKVAFAN